jgi:hypothetical protein
VAAAGTRHRLDLAQCYPAGLTLRWAARLRGERTIASADPQPAGSRLPEKSAAARKLEAGRTGMRRETYAYCICAEWVCVCGGITCRAGRRVKSSAWWCGPHGGFLGSGTWGIVRAGFDVLAIDNRRGMAPEVRLHKDAFSPQMSWE